MASVEPVVDRILEAVQRTQEYDLDTLAKDLPDLSWSQVFLEVDRLSRQGLVQMKVGPKGRYIIRLPHRVEPPVAQDVRS